jgi:hypothetical protein
MIVDHNSENNAPGGEDKTREQTYDAFRKSLQDHPVHLGLGAASIPMTAITSGDWYEQYERTMLIKTGDEHEGRLISYFTFSENWPMWECHPFGTEIVTCTKSQLVLLQVKETTSISDNGDYQNSYKRRRIRHQRSRRVAHGGLHSRKASNGSLHYFRKGDEAHTENRIAIVLSFVDETKEQQSFRTSMHDFLLLS